MSKEIDYTVVYYYRLDGDGIVDLAGKARKTDFDAMMETGINTDVVLYGGDPELRQGDWFNSTGDLVKFGEGRAVAVGSLISDLPVPCEVSVNHTAFVSLNTPQLFVSSSLAGTFEVSIQSKKTVRQVLLVECRADEEAPSGSDQLTVVEIEHPIPSSCSKLGLKRVLAELGIWPAVKALLASDEDLQEDWELATQVHRDDPLVQPLVSQLKLTPKKIDYILVRANQLSA